MAVLFSPKCNIYICSLLNFEKIMAAMETFVNKVAESSLVTFDLQDLYPKEEIKVFDLKDFLFMGLILKEKDYRLALQQLDWTVYENKNVAIYCSADAIIPVWAYMLAATYLQPIAKEVVLGDEKKLIETVLINRIEKLDASEYTDKRMVIKGCGEIHIPESAYVAITNKLRPITKSIMYGEPCSTVPIFKKK